MSPPAPTHDDGRVDFDPHRFDDADQAHAAYARLRRECPVAHSDRHGGFHVLTGHADVRAAAGDHATFSSASGHLLPEPGARMLPPIDFDPPEHTRWRRMFRALLDADARRRLESHLPAIADGLIDRFAPRGSCDLVADYAEPLALLAIARLAGLDDERAPVMHELVLHQFAQIGDPEAFRAASRQVAGFFLAELDERRAAPRDDALTALTREPLTDDELVGVCVSILGAGHHSTTSALSSLLHRVGADAELRARLVADPPFAAPVIEETLRLHTPLHSFRRRTTRPARIAGTEIGAGEDVLLVFAAANRDPAVFGEPDAFDPDRRPNPHLAFGCGIHVCVGAQIARLELRIALGRLLARTPDVHLPDPRPSRVLSGGKLDLITALPATFSPS